MLTWLTLTPLFVKHCQFQSTIRQMLIFMSKKIVKGGIYFCVPSQKCIKEWWQLYAALRIVDKGAFISLRENVTSPMRANTMVKFYS